VDNDSEVILYDVIVVGARVAGSPTAMLLARRGYRVLLVDTATFPSDIMSTHAVKIPGGAALQRWGLLDRVLRAANCPPIRQATFDVGPFVLKGWAPPLDGVSADHAPRRTTLDKVLVDAAVESGVELREGFAVDEMLLDGERVTGIRGRGRNGGSVDEKAPIVVGADGLHSIVARAVNAPTYNTRPALACYYYSYWSGIPIDGVELYPRDGRAVIAIPTNDGLVCILVGWRSAEFHAFRADIEGNYLKTLDLAPSVAERVRSAKREERFVGTGDLPNYFRKPFGPGWALVGDAGYHKDPITAWGITDGFLDAELLTEAIDAGLTGRRELTDALGAYEQRRNERAMPYYELTCQFATLQPPPPELAQLLVALRDNPEQTNRFFGAAIVGTVPVQEFFSPENIRKIVGAGASVGAARS
jgi:flavin-dependent dehydrogenase